MINVLMQTVYMLKVMCQRIFYAHFGIVWGKIMIQIWNNDTLVAIYAYKKDAIAFLQENETLENPKIVEVKE